MFLCAGSLPHQSRTTRTPLPLRCLPTAPGRSPHTPKTPKHFKQGSFLTLAACPAHVQSKEWRRVKAPNTALSQQWTGSRWENAPDCSPLA